MNKLIFLLILITPILAAADFECGQNSNGVQLRSFDIQSTSSSSNVQIDYAVFYTPNAKSSEGGENAMHQRITSAFEGANKIFSDSGSNVVHRLVHTQELPLNNTSETLPELNTELASGFDFFSVLDQVKADTVIVVVEFQRPGGYANIPLSPGQALKGGGINLGLTNLSGSVLAHEIGHTLGANHDYADTQGMFYIPPTYGYGNHFIGASSGNCYRTIMSALTTCRIAGYQNLPAISCNLFSNSNLIYEGTPTGDPVRADAIKVFSEFAPYVASARGDSQQPNPDDPTPTPSPGEGDILTLRIKKTDRGFRATGRCATSAGIPLTGDSISILLVNSRLNTEKQLSTAMCSNEGKYRALIKRGGKIKAKNLRSGTESKIVRARKS